MYLVNLYEKQLELDTIISERLKTVDPAFDMYSVVNIDKKIFAFKVELAELSNEVGFFKYWKHSHVMDKPRVIDEWADCLHFLLSVGLGKKWDRYALDVISSVKPILDLKTAAYLFYALMGNELNGSVKYAQALNLLVTIGHTLGYTDDELKEAYLNKNAVNIKRQKEGY